MKAGVILIICLVLGIKLSAQEKLYIHKSDYITLGALLSETDSIYFDNNGATTFFSVDGTIAEYSLSEIDSISFGANSDTVKVVYNGSMAQVVNPLAFEGVSVEVDGADVTAVSTTDVKDIKFCLSGSTSDGMFKLYSKKRSNLLLNGVDITNNDGPAINLQADKKVIVTLVDGAANTITDGSSYASPALDNEGEEEDQDAAFFCEDDLVFEGGGSVVIYGNGSKKHALCSDDCIEIENGTIIIKSAQKDGVHANDGFEISGGEIDITANGDAIDADEGYIKVEGGDITTTSLEDDVKALKCDSTIVIAGGTLNISIEGNQSKAIKSKQDITLSGGEVTINASGDVVLEESGSGYDPSYCTAVKSDGDIIVSGATVKIVSSGKAGKGMSSESSISVKGGSVEVKSTGGGGTYTNEDGDTDSYHSTCLAADGDIVILNGSYTSTSSGSAGKSISGDGKLVIGDENNTPVIDITTTGSKITVSSSGNGGWPGGHGGHGGSQDAEYDEAKGIKADGAIVINNGEVKISAADDGIKSDESVTVNNGTVSIENSVEGIESPEITINNGNVSIAASDDGFNATYGNGGESNDGSCLYFYGGKVVASVTDGDGLDSNGDIVMSDGTVIVHGPSSQVEVGMDFNGNFNISGGLLMVSGGNSNMVEAPSSSSSQYSVKAMANSRQAANKIFHVEDSDGNDIITFEPERNYYSVIFSSPNLKNGSGYKIYTGGSSTGENTDGLYTGGTYSGGTLKKSFTVSRKVTSVSF